ncbi:MAG TPA: hypothetical protein DEA87_03430 [Candidatus Veblenbacteria bacterium]|uniref:POTRA domain-containing protein n=2 Tax=Candidatus Vebleniibacteriota TaxID=1817921 RepID=A0A1G2Q543_9BACT|nr:MAG: hypothetical protein UV52_C0032G0007 [Parcubacteria group bacterium GW2011_GWD1_42_9]KKS93477.1 MAG: hypothetical protein UV69_C0007G0007 [Parcubacteria group bacterium GW2011_GWE2_43_12]KKT14197.1 MAG: hypothetical protein UV92_C0004G0025 [Parcubacteria group bacterium GW2011_GWA1_43_27]KKT14458.1 MAG: hypothetical protein UV96_C0029G0003 [Parcubacteria group bacterium GW2011_GWF2_43_38]KKT21951.1 MAG: hypothetical protein UW06_C0025G0008 [Parcubacteria group bacterium GW2011_GWE1_43_8
MVSLTYPKPVRRSVRRRDFAPTNHRAPVVTRRLSQAYHRPSVPPWRKWLNLSIFIFCVGFLLAIVYSPLFTIKNVVINNVGFKPTEERLKEIVAGVMSTRLWLVFPQSNLILFNPGHAREVLATEFYIEDVKFVRHWPNVLKIDVANNVIVAILKTDQGDFLLDRRGVLVQQLSSATDNDRSLPLLLEKDSPVRNLGDQTIKPELVTFIDDLYDNWRQLLPELLPQYILLDPTALPTLQLNMPEGWYVNVTGESDAKPQIASLKRLLEERIKDDRAKLQYIDVRFGNRLYFKLK